MSPVLTRNVDKSSYGVLDAPGPQTKVKVITAVPGSLEKKARFCAGRKLRGQRARVDVPNTRT